jgi:hypothetical protein
MFLATSIRIYEDEVKHATIDDRKRESRRWGPTTLGMRVNALNP